MGVDDSDRSARPEILSASPNGTELNGDGQEFRILSAPLLSTSPSIAAQSLLDAEESVVYAGCVALLPETDWTGSWHATRLVATIASKIFPACLRHPSPLYVTPKLEKPEAHGLTQRRKGAKQPEEKVRMLTKEDL